MLPDGSATTRMRTNKNAHFAYTSVPEQMTDDYESPLNFTAAFDSSKIAPQQQQHRQKQKSQHYTKVRTKTGASFEISGIINGPVRKIKAPGRAHDLYGPVSPRAMKQTKKKKGGEQRKTYYEVSNTCRQ